MAKLGEYIGTRFHDGTRDRVSGLKDYLASESDHPVRPCDIDQSEVLRKLTYWALEVFERRAETWRAESAMDKRS
ncbi:MAG: hypothetical protein P1V36_00170 [Planctomycetota bacterium]|nr:hypothetical protein [Planctomycetota bacterium]